MSLLNTMLRDLEQNQAARSGGVGDNPVLESVEREVTPLRFSRVLVAGLIVGLVVYMTDVYFGQNQVAVSGSPLTDATDFHKQVAYLEHKLTDFPASLALGANFLQTQTAQSLAWLAEVAGVNTVSVLPSRTVEKQETETTAPSAASVKQRKPEVEVQQQYLQITRSSRSLDLEAATKARELLAKGSVSSAETLLLSQLESNPQAIASVQMLADIYFDRAAQNELAWLATNTRFADNSLRAYVLARHYTLENDNVLALSILGETTPHALIEEKYSGLQAALYQKTGAYAQAEKLYAQLLAKNNQSLPLWLGYALASDANNNPGRALGAYRQVLQLKGLNAGVENYVQSRIDTLVANKAEYGR